MNVQMGSGKTLDEQDLQSTFKGSFWPGDLRPGQGLHAHFPTEVVGYQHCWIQARKHANRSILHAGHIWDIQFFDWIYLLTDQQTLT